MMIIFLLLCTNTVLTGVKGYNDSTTDGSLPNPQHIWHSYVFNTGAGNREELHFSNIELNSNFESVSGVFSWKSLQMEKQVAVIGLAENFVSVTTINEENNSFTYKHEMEESAKALTTFQKWNVNTQAMESFIVVAAASTEEKYTLLWYQVLNKKLKYLWDWQSRGNIIHLDMIKINFESKLMVISQRSAHRKPSAEIYNFNINHGLELWLFETIILDGSPSSVTVFDSNDNVFFCVSFPSSETVEIFRYSKSSCLDSLEKKHFVPHQKVFSIGLKSITSFQVGFRWHLAVASSSSLVYYIGDDLLFQPLSTPLGDFSNWLAVPVDTYREDMLLLADSGFDVSAVTWTGDKNLKSHGSFTKLACGDDVHCTEKMKTVALNESTAFTFNGHQGVIVSGKNGIPLFFKLIIKLKPLPDKTTLKLKEILNTRNLLERDYLSQNEQVNALLSKKENQRVTIETKQEPKTASQIKNKQEILDDLNQLKATLNSLNANSEKFFADLKSIFSIKSGQNSETFFNGNVTDGITFYGDVLINELNLKTINGHPVNELLEDSFRKNKIQKIGGKKTLKKLSVENIIFEKLEDIPACDIVFSDDAWDRQNNNIINGDIIWQNKLTVLNNVKLLQEENKRNSSPGKVRRGILKPAYDTLSFKELEISEDFHVQRSVNGQPIILPVHGGHFNILDIVNQARFEVVNVNQNLNVEFINGKNYTTFVESVLQRSPTPTLKFDSIKVEGLFSAPSIQTDRLNGIELSNELQEFTERDKISELDASTRVEDNELKRSRNEILKRVIHVFENVEIEGILFSNKINNISWTFLNDTVKKNEETVTLAGTKTFQKPMKSKKVNLSGTINGRFVDHILDNFSDQTVRFPQSFEKVEFKNLTLEGTWDGIFVNQLNESLLRLSSNNSQSDLTFEECHINVLNVTNTINDANVNDGAQKPLKGKIELKSIKADHVILHGSLITNNQINNVNITNFNMLRVSLKSPETFDQDLYHYNVTVSGDLSVETLNFNDVSSILNSGGDIKLIDNFMSGKIDKMKKLLVKGNISTTHGINGFDLPKIFEKGIRITKPGSIQGNITFENILYFDNINVTHSIDGFPLKNLEKDIVFKHSHVFLTGPKNFSTIRVMKSMMARSLNGHLTQEILTSKGDHTVKGPIRINGDVIVRGNITSYSGINNVTVPDLLKSYSTRFNSFIYSGDLNLNNREVTIGNLLVGGRIQNVYLDALIADSIRKDDGMNGLLNVSGRKSFKGEVKFKENVTVEGLIQGVNFTELYSNLVFINKPAKLKGTVTIQESVLKDLETVGHFNSTLINNIDTNDWVEDCIPLDKHEVVREEKVFEQAYSLQDVSVDFINGHLPSAMISLKKKQHIPMLALFPRIHTTSDLSVEGFVNGRNLLREFQDNLQLNGPQTISGKTVFEDEFLVNGTVFVDTVMGKPINSLITLDTDQVIRTPLEFKGRVTAKKDVEDLRIINNISLSDWNERSVLLNQKQVLSGLWTVKGKVKTKNIEGEGLLHSVSLPSISKDIQKGRLTALEIKNATQLEFSEQCREVQKLSQRFSTLPYLLDQFEMVYEIETSAVIESVISFKIRDENNLAVTFVNECLSSLYLWNKDNSTFYFKRQINIGPVSKWLALNRRSATYLVTSSSSSRTCEENLQRGNIWVFKGDVDGYAHLLTTDPFVDIAQEDSSSNEFFTIDESGVLQQWTLQENENITFKFLYSFGSDNYRFVDFRILGGLAVSNNREIKQISLDEDKVIERNLPFSSSQILALPLDGKVLTAAVGKDKIVIYEDILEEKVFCVVHTYRAGSVLWFNYGPEKQAFLIVASHHKLIEVYEYKSVSGLVKKISIQMFSNKLQSVALPVRNKYHEDKFVIVIQRKKLGFVRAGMFGDYFQKSDLVC